MRYTVIPGTGRGRRICGYIEDCVASGDPVAAEDMSDSGAPIRRSARQWRIQG